MVAFMKKAIQLLQSVGGQSQDLQDLGIPEETIKVLIEKGIIEPLGYRLKKTSPPTFPYSLISDPLPLFLHGWFSAACRERLQTLIEKHNVQTIVELGSWLGQSTLFMASLLPERGKLYAIDHWEGPEDLQIPCVYKQFLSNVIHAQLTHKIVPLRTTTQEASKDFESRVDLIYIDACHEEEAVYQDLKDWFPIAKKWGSLLCGDDFYWKKEKGYPVQKALNRFCREENLTYVNTDVFWEIIR